MVVIKSQRARDMLNNSISFTDKALPDMKKYPGEEMQIWVSLELEGQNVKKLSFFGEASDELKVILEALSRIMTKKNLSFLEVITLRECEAFLRDRNSQESIEGLDKNHEKSFKSLIDWIRHLNTKGPAKNYQFPSEKGLFQRLKLVDKVRELKAFLDSAEVRELYAGKPAPELLDVEDLTVFLSVSYQTEEDRTLLEELHILAVSVFQEESLNLIPEG